MIPEFLIPTVLAIIPGIEIRGAVLYANLKTLGLLEGYILPFIVSMAIVPGVYLGFKLFFDWLMGFSFFRKNVERVRKKVSKYVDRYGFLGLILFVAVPLPGSGLYTGTLGSLVLGLDNKRAIPALYVGNLLSFLITLFIVNYLSFVITVSL